MKAKELRIGNLVTINNRLLTETEGQYYKVSGIQSRYDIDFPDSSGVISLDHTKSIKTYSQFDEFIQPIPLTEEWLLKFGFKYDHKCNECSIFGGFTFTIGKVKDSDCWFSYEIKMDGGGYFKYVHELQNLIFALTGNELEIE